MDVLPALSGVGYICGTKIASYMFSGGVLSYLVLIPAIAYFGGANTIVGSNATEIVGNIWGSYVRYIGAGAVAAGGIISLIKTLPTMVKTFGHAIKGFGKNVKNGDRTQQDLSMAVVLAGIIIIASLMCIFPGIPVSPLGAILIIIFGFFFATVSSRMVGLVGSSNNPVSGMAIATLVITTFVLKATGTTGAAGMIAAISIGTVICIVAAMAGDTSQDLKTGYIVGATPKKQQIGEIIGTIVSALSIGGVMYLLSNAWGGFGSEQLAAPQASLMKIIIEGVMGGTLPWVLIFLGVFIAIVVEILGIPVLAFAIGLYLPIHLSAAIMMGGLVRWKVERKTKYSSEKQKKECVDKGILYSAGMIAGEGIVGILLAVLAVIGLDKAIDFSSIYGNNFQTEGNWVSIVAFFFLILSIFFFCRKKKEDKV